MGSLFTSALRIIFSFTRASKKGSTMKYELISIDLVDISGVAEIFINYNLFKSTQNQEVSIIFAERPLKLLTIQELVQEYFPRNDFEQIDHQWLFNRFFQSKEPDRVFKIQSLIELKSNLLVLLCTQYRNQFETLTF